MPETKTQAADMEACMQAAQPGPEHERLGQFEGKWRARTRLWMGPGEPMENSGTMTNTWVLGGRFLKQDYKQDDGQFEGIGYFGFNNISREYEGMWIDVMATGMNTEKGTCDAAGKVWTMSGQAQSPDGKTFTKRSVVTVADKDRHTMEMYFTGPDGGEFKAMEIEYTRA